MGTAEPIQASGPRHGYRERPRVYLAIIVPTPDGKPTSSNGYAVGFGCVSILIFLAIAIAAGFGALDSWGWVPHSKAVDLYVSGDWQSGETRSCLGIQSRLPDEPPEVTSLDCRIDGSAENTHNRKDVSVTFLGRISRPDLLFSGAAEFNWGCRREGSWFICRTLN